MPAAAGSGFVPGRHPIDAYGGGGFRFAGMSHRGSVLVLPSGIRAWTPATATEIDAASLAPVFDKGASIDLLLLGTGLDVAAAPDWLLVRFREAKIGLDVMQTGAAARTYNVLLAEDRRVGAALIAVE